MKEGRRGENSLSGMQGRILAYPTIWLSLPFLPLLRSKRVSENVCAVCVPAPPTFPVLLRSSIVFTVAALTAAAAATATVTAAAAAALLLKSCPALTPCLPQL